MLLHNEMYKNLRKINVFIVIGLAAAIIGAFSLNLLFDSLWLFPKTVHAASGLNGDPSDPSTLRVSNYTQFPDSTTNWESTINASPGEVVSFAIYYHNTGAENVENLRISLFQPTGSSTSFNVVSQLTSDNYDSLGGNAVVNISASEQLVYIPGSAKWYPNQSQTPSQFPFGQSGDEVVTGQGVNVGSISPGWATQGSVVARFQISNSGTGGSDPLPSQDPTADLKANFSDTLVTLNNNEDLTLSWSSLNSVSCNFSGVFSSGVGVSGELTITPAHPFYPTSDGATYTITCDNGFGKSADDTVTVNISGNNPGGNPLPPAPSSVDITANSSQGPYTLSTNESFNLEWISSNVISCTLSSVGVFSSGVAVNDTLGPISPAHPYYPPEGGSRTYEISCDNSGGSSVTDSVVVTRPTQPPQPPQPPVLDVSISNQCGGLVDLSWTLVSGATHYEIYRNGVHVLNVSLSQYTDINLSVGVSYTYVVKAVLGPGNTLASNTDSATASGACPPQVSSVDITANSSQGPYTLSTNESFNLEWISSNVISCTLSSVGVFSSGVAVNDTLGPISPAHPYYPQEGTSRTYNITCQNSAGGTVTDSVTVVRPGNPPQAPVIAATTGTQCGGTINVSWNQVSGATFYKVFRNGNLIATTTENSFTDAVSVNSSNSYTVKSVNNFGDSTPSNQATAISSSSCPTAPDKPTITAQTSTECGGKILISWGSVSNATFYKVFRDNTLIATTTNLSFTDTVSPGTNHNYTLKATNNIGDSAESDSKSASGSNSCPLPPPLPTVNLTANPESINQGQNSILSWTSTNTTSCSAPWTTSTSTDDSQVVNPATTTTYSITCTGSGGSATDTATVNISVPLPPPDNTCVIPTASSAQGAITFGQSFGSELTLQQILDNNGYNINALSDQKNYQVWDVSGTASKVKLVIKVIDNQADNKQVFGYFVNGDKNTFQGLFEVGNHTNYALPIHNPGDVVNVEINTLNISSIGFAIDTQSENSSKRFYTQTQFNHDGEIHAVVYNQASNKYVLTFEDLPKDNYDRDFQDLVLEISNVECVGLQCNAPTFTSSSNVNGKVGEALSYTIAATSTNSSSITYSVATSSLPNGLNFSGNTISGTPTSTGTFKVLITATNDCGSTTFELTIIISQLTPTVTLSADPSTIDKGQNSTLSWTSSNVTSCSAPWTNATTTAGFQVVSPESTTTYEISCVGAGGTATSSATITVNTGGGGGNPPSVSLSANPSSIFLGATSTLSWNGSNVDSCVAPWATATTTSGSQIVSPATTTSYSILCSGINGNASATTTITVSATSSLSVILTANPPTIPQGATSTLSWTSNNATGCSAPWTSATTTSGNQIVNPATTTEYMITCVNSSQSATSSATVTVTQPIPSVTLTADPSSINPGGSSTLSWTGSNVSSCTAAWTSATSTTGSQVVTPSSTTNYEIICSGSFGNATGTATVTVATGGGGGGGGGSSRGSRGGDRIRPIGEVLGASTSCDYLRDYLRIGWNNDPIEVMKLQIFLRELEGFKNLQVTGVFDQATFDAVAVFQVRYQPDILTPWGYAQGQYTGFVYILTKKKVNEIVCQRAFPLNAGQELEIEEFRAFMESLRARGISSGILGPGFEEPTIVPTNPQFPQLPIYNPETPTTTTPTTTFPVSGFGEKFSGVAGAILSGPQGWNESLNAILIFLAILLLIYLISTAVVENQTKTPLPDPKTLRERKMLYFLIGIIVAIIGSFILKYYDIILPLLVLLIILASTALWMSFNDRSKVSMQSGELNLEGEE